MDVFLADHGHLPMTVYCLVITDILTQFFVFLASSDILTCVATIGKGFCHILVLHFSLDRWGEEESVSPICLIIKKVVETGKK